MGSLSMGAGPICGTGDCRRHANAWSWQPVPVSPGGPYALISSAFSPHNATQDPSAGAKAQKALALRRTFLADGFVCLRGAFPSTTAAAIAEDALEQQKPSGMYHAYESVCGYFRTDAGATVTPDEVAQCHELQEAIEVLLDSKLYGTDDTCADGFFATATVSKPGDGEAFFRHSVVGHRATNTPSPRPWAPPDGLRPHTFEPIGCMNGWHIDDGFNPNAHERDFRPETYLASPWLIVVVLLTDVTEEGGPTCLCRGTHDLMARLLTASPGCLNTNAIYSFCAAAAQFAQLGGVDLVRATGQAGDVYLLHPMLLHTATISTTGAARAILNMPIPYGQYRVAQKQGGLSSVNLPIHHAAGQHYWTPRPVLWVLWRLAVATGWLHRVWRGQRGVTWVDYLRARLLFIPSAALLLVSTICFLLLDLGTRPTTPHSQLPIVDDVGRTGTAAWLASLKVLVQSPEARERFLIRATRDTVEAARYVRSAIIARRKRSQQTRHHHECRSSVVETACSAAGEELKPLVESTGGLASVDNGGGREQAV